MDFSKYFTFIKLWVKHAAPNFTFSCKILTYLTENILFKFSDQNILKMDTTEPAETLERPHIIYAVARYRGVMCRIRALKTPKFTFKNNL
jgi:hypothetical protein